MADKRLMKCRYCKQQNAEVYKVQDLFYVRCKGTKKVVKKTKHKDGTVTTVTETKKCAAWSPYEFLGLTAQAAIENWNTRNGNNWQKDEQ